MDYERETITILRKQIHDMERTKLKNLDEEKYLFNKFTFL